METGSFLGAWKVFLDRGFGAEGVKGSQVDSEREYGWFISCISLIPTPSFSELTDPCSLPPLSPYS